MSLSTAASSMTLVLVMLLSACDDGTPRGSDAAVDGTQSDSPHTDSVESDSATSQDLDDEDRQSDTNVSTDSEGDAEDTATSGDSAAGADSASLDAQDTADTVSTRRSCTTDEDCPTTVPCESDGYCREVACHLGRLTSNAATTIADLPCPDGQVCDVLLVDSGYTWTCQTYATSCAFDDTCLFGFLCLAGSCVHAECTLGNTFSQWGPRPCPGSEVCACMEDGVELNGGRGQCVPLDSTGQPDFTQCQ